MVAASLLHKVEAGVMSLAFLLQGAAMWGPAAMWSSTGAVVVEARVATLGGCGMFACDGPPACGCVETGCVTDCRRTGSGCPSAVSDAQCDDLAGHMAVAQAFAIVALLAMVVALAVSVVQVTPLRERVNSTVCARYIFFFRFRPPTADLPPSRSIFEPFKECF